MHTLKNNLLEITVNTIGAELCRITSVRNGTDYMWNGDPDVWEHFAPNLFPIIGALKNDSYIFEEKTYKLPKHGIVRRNAAVVLHEQTKNSLTFQLSYSEDSLKVYPFKFEFLITYTLIDNILTVLHKVKNLDTKPLYFSVGGHPAFKCPVFEDEFYDDYSLLFEHLETSETHLINTANGLIKNEIKPVLSNTNKLPLTHKMFNDDALIFKDLQSKKITLHSKNHGNILTVNYHDFDYLGIWAKPTGNYVCIEPWLGIADNETTNQEFTTKEGIIKLAVGNTFEANYSIEIH